MCAGLLLLFWCCLIYCVCAVAVCFSEEKVSDVCSCKSRRYYARVIAMVLQCSCF